MPTDATAAAALLAHLQVPVLMVSGGQVTFANDAARELLGSHIVGQDVRIAIRNPAAVAVILSSDGGSVRVDGLSVPGSVWRIVCSPLSGDDRLISLYDQSVQVGVARAHADFVANASHELRTPLATVLGYVETLMDPRAGEDAATRERFLSTIRHEALRMQALVEDLMSLSRIEAVKHDSPAGELDAVALSREVAAEFPTSANITVVTNCDTAIISGDRGQLAQVLRNLIDNAVKYGKPGGLISIAIEATDTGWLSLAVRDDGDGIAPEHLPRLTERFYRPDTSRSRAAGGTGLGLSIVKHIVERHRGRFDITSRAGDGTRASLMLPLRKRA